MSVLMTLSDVIDYHDEARVGNLLKWYFFWKSYYKLCLTVVKGQTGWRPTFQSIWKDTCVPGHPLSFPKQSEAWSLWPHIRGHCHGYGCSLALRAAESIREEGGRSFIGMSMQRNLWVKAWSHISTCNWEMAFCERSDQGTVQCLRVFDGQDRCDLEKSGNSKD